MNYIGSKKSLLSFIEDAVDRCDVAYTKTPVFCDIFAGTGRVGRHFKEKGFSIIANDMEKYSYSLINHYIKNHKEINIDNYLLKLNSLSGIEGGFVFNYYCPSGKHSKVERKTNSGIELIGRQYFSDENGKIIDEARVLIEDWHNAGVISDEVYRYLLAVIIEAADKVANTASVYGAFLKKLKKTALERIKFTKLDYAVTPQSHQTYNMDANDLIKNISGDILYLDPPYNGRQYGANYHVLNTIASYDNPEVRGVTGMRDYTPSLWCKRKSVETVFEEMIKEADFKYILFSYNSESFMQPDKIKEIMLKYGEYDFIVKNYSRFKADNNNENRNYKANSVSEYVHILKK